MAEGVDRDSCGKIEISIVFCIVHRHSFTMVEDEWHTPIGAQDVLRFFLFDLI